MSHYYGIALIDDAAFEQLRPVLGDLLKRTIGYLEEDGPRAIGAIERAMHERRADGLVAPAHRLKGDALQLGALRLGALAEAIETEARESVEEKRWPEGLVAEIAMLRACFQQTVRALHAMECGHEADAAQPVLTSLPPSRVPPAAAAVRSGTARPVFGRRQTP